MRLCCCGVVLINGVSTTSVRRELLLAKLVTFFTCTFCPAQKVPKRRRVRFLPACPRNTSLRYRVGNNCAGVGVETSTQLLGDEYIWLFDIL